MGWYIWFIIIVLFLAFFLAVYFFIIRDNEDDVVVSPDSGGGDDNGGGGDPTLLRCRAGQCVTNKLSGNKFCSDDPDAELRYNPATQTCNFPNTCDSNFTPFAVNPDLSTNSTGFCEGGTTCNCLPNPQCAYNILVSFEVTEGNNFWSSSSQNLVLEQRYAYQDSLQNSAFLPPISIPAIDQDKIQCTITNDQINRIWPTVCARGTLAYLPDNVDDFNTIDDANMTVLGCVPGLSCGEQVAVWDKNTSQLVCKSICPQGKTMRWNQFTLTNECV